MNNTDIEKVNTFKFLGLALDTNIKWKTHTQNVASKICQINGILKRMKYIFPQRVLLIIYNSLIEAYINYCLLLWGKSPGRVLSLQKRALRTISLSNYNSHTSPLFKTLGLLTVHDMYTLKLLRLYYKIKTLATPPYFKHFLDNYNHELLKMNEIKHNFRNRRIVIPLPKREYLKRNAKIQLEQLICKFDKDILDRVEHTNIYRYGKEIKLYFINKYTTKCNIKDCYVCENT